MGNQKQTIERGGADLERLYLHDCRVDTPEMTILVRKSNMPRSDMGDVILRHIGRYGFALPFIRPGYKILDFPCGSGVALEAFAPLSRYGSFEYHGWEFDGPTVDYCKEVHARYPWAHFRQEDLTTFSFLRPTFDTICCIEGIEHIGPIAQKRAVRKFHDGLVSGGTFVISSPPPLSGVSGPNPRNTYHLWELTQDDFKALLSEHFGRVEIVSQENTLTTGEFLTCHYAICKKS